jgi:hypothetical protein
LFRPCPDDGLEHHDRTHARSASINLPSRHLALLRSQHCLVARRQLLRPLPVCSRNAVFYLTISRLCLPRRGGHQKPPPKNINEDTVPESPQTAGQRRRAEGGARSIPCLPSLANLGSSSISLSCYFSQTRQKSVSSRFRGGSLSRLRGAQDEAIQAEETLTRSDYESYVTTYDTKQQDCQGTIDEVMDPWTRDFYFILIKTNSP